jgi:hypothetical protein
MLPSLALESESHRPASWFEGSLASSSSKARASVGAAAANPSVKRIANASSGGRDGRRAAGDFDVAGQRAPERLEVGLAGKLGVDRLKATGGGQKQAAGIAAASLLHRDLGLQEVDSGAPELVERVRLDVGQ